MNIAVPESVIDVRAKDRPPDYKSRLASCRIETVQTAIRGTVWIIDTEHPEYQRLLSERRLWKASKSASIADKYQPYSPPLFTFPGVGDALAWAFGLMGYEVNAGCSCKATQRWANERRWHECTRASVRRELLTRLSDEARRRKILPRCRCKVACSRDSWGRLIRAGIRDRARAAWLAIQQAGRGHAHGPGHHRRPDPRA